MPITLRCPTCNARAQVPDAAVGTARCPHCDEVLGRPKPRAEPAGQPPRAAQGRKARDGAAAARAGVADGFGDPGLMDQVTEYLEPGEVLHLAVRPAPALARYEAAVYGLIAAAFAVIPGSIGLSILTKDKGGEALLGLVPLAVGLAAAAAVVLAPRARMRQARRGWYAVTDRRAVVYDVALLSGKGEATTYTPADVRRMWVRKSFWLKGGGDVVFKTVVRTTTEVSERSEKTTKSTTHYGFLGVADVEAVRDVIEDVLLAAEED